MTGSEKRAGLLVGWRFGFVAAWLFALVFLGAPPSPASEFTGRVVGIADGDTLTVREDGGAAIRIRLWGIDAPERGQAYTSVAKRYLSSLAFGKMVRVLVRDQDRYGRTVAEIILPDGRNANQEMVRAGYAWWFRRYAPDDGVLEQLETEARQARRGAVGRPPGDAALGLPENEALTVKYLKGIIQYR
jgi:endonuclease YncB( thermonuclease family)